MKLGLKGINTSDALMWGGLGVLAVVTYGMLGSSLTRTGQAFENLAEVPAVKNAFLAWSEGMPYRDRSIWYQWKSDFGSNDPTKRLTVA